MIPGILHINDMNEAQNLSRFIEAQKIAYNTALKEIKNGRKQSHWMWYIFPQIKGLGFTDTSIFYAISGLPEAEAYLAHPILGKRIVEISSALLELNVNDPGKILGSPDDLKLKSSMTLFASVRNSNPVFQHVLDKFYAGQKDKKTLELLGASPV